MQILRLRRFTRVSQSAGKLSSCNNGAPWVLGRRRRDGQGGHRSHLAVYKSGNCCFRCSTLGASLKTIYGWFGCKAA